jgi:hypothetical protein
MQKLAVELVREAGEGKSTSRYKVLDVVFVDQTHFRAGRYYCYSTPNQAIRIRTMLLDKNKLVIEEDKLEQMVTLEDFKVVDADSIEEIKRAKLKELHSRMNEKMAVVSGLKLYSFFSDMVRLAAHGYFITDENREEVYLKIIDTADEDLIQCLETYLDSKDSIDQVTNFHRNSRTFITKLNMAETDEEIEKVIEEYEKFRIY